MSREHAAEPHQNHQAAGEAGSERAERPPGRVHRHGAEPGVGEHGAAAAGLREKGRDEPRGVRAQGAVRDGAGRHPAVPGRVLQGARLAADRDRKAQVGPRPATTEVHCGSTCTESLDKSPTFKCISPKANN